MLNDGKTIANNAFKIVLLTIAVMLCLTVMTIGGSAAETDGLDINSNEIGTVQVTADGKTTLVTIDGRTQVDEILESLNIDLGELDTINKQLSSYVQADDHIKVVRNGYSTRIVEGVIPSKTIYTYSENVAPGKEVVLVEGKDGYGKQVYKQLVENDVVKEETLVSAEYSVEPINKQIGVGFKSTPVSDFDFEWDFDENREPIGHVKVLRDQRSTAYTARPGALTASGRKAMVGHVAVNPNVIPYGSKLFIQSNDGKLVYGYAIAADTGTALMSGVAHVDLYFDTMGECISHGVKSVDIFVLETPQK